MTSAASPDGGRSPSTSTSAPLWLPPTVVGTEALRAPGAEIARRRQARRDAGLAEDGLDYPRAGLWLVAVLPAAVLALLCLIALVISGGVVWGIAGAGAAALAGTGVGYLRADPLRVPSADRRQLVADRAWHSQQPWTGATADTRERRLVARAQDAVQRLVRAPAWRSAAFEEHRLRLDLKAELDEVDRQAHDLVASRANQAGPAQSAELEALTARVGALCGYVDAVVALPAGRELESGRSDDDGAQHALSAAVRDEFATQQWNVLTGELSGPAWPRPSDPA